MSFPCLARCYMDRGVIRNRQFATQIRDFSTLRIGTITPTDVDGLIEYRNKCFILIETKHGNSELPRGQELALERLCDSMNKPTMLIVASHNTDGDIDVGGCVVTKYRYAKVWHKPKWITVTEMCKSFIKSVEAL